MVHFAFFYFLLVLAAHITGYFKSITIAPLVIPYVAILYYFLKDITRERNFQYQPEVLNCLIIALVVFQFDNIIFFYFTLQRSLPVLVRVEIIICLITFIIGIAGFFMFIPLFSKYNLYICCVSIFLIHTLLIFFAAKPNIDVYVHLKEAVEYFLAGKNPYANLYTQIYSPEQIRVFYYNNPVFQKYVPYQSVPPVSIAIYAVGHLLGDIRIINAILFCASPILLKRICSIIFPEFSDDAHKKMALVSLLFPSQQYLIFFAWTDISLGFFIILFIYFFLNQQEVASYIALGIFLSLKQYSVIYVIPVLFVVNLKDWKLYLVTGGMIIFPLVFYAMWNINGFIDGIILFELKQPFRMDSISIPALMVRYLGIKISAGVLLSILVLFLSLAISVYYAFKKMYTLDSEFKKMRFMLYVILFQFANLVMFSKQSFLNQYFFLIMIFYLAMLFSINPVPGAVKFPATNEN